MGTTQPQTRLITPEEHMDMEIKHRHCKVLHEELVTIIKIYPLCGNFSDKEQLKRINKYIALLTPCFREYLGINDIYELVDKNWNNIQIIYMIIEDKNYRPCDHMVDLLQCYRKCIIENNLEYLHFYWCKKYEDVEITDYDSFLYYFRDAYTHYFTNSRDIYIIYLFIQLAIIHILNHRLIIHISPVNNRKTKFIWELYNFYILYPAFLCGILSWCDFALERNLNKQIIKWRKFVNIVIIGNMINCWKDPSMEYYKKNHPNVYNKFKITRAMLIINDFAVNHVIPTLRHPKLFIARNLYPFYEKIENREDLIEIMINHINVKSIYFYLADISNYMLSMDNIQNYTIKRLIKTKAIRSSIFDLYTDVKKYCDV